jgi:chromosome segregation and condensation protein ScpB
METNRLLNNFDVILSCLNKEQKEYFGVEIEELVKAIKDSIPKDTIRKLLEEKEESYKNTGWELIKIDIDLLKQILKEQNNAK